MGRDARLPRHWGRDKQPLHIHPSAPATPREPPLAYLLGMARAGTD